MSAAGAEAELRRPERRLLGESPAVWAAVLVETGLILSVPSFVTPYELLNYNGLLAPVCMAISLALLWGRMGVLSLGHVVFYGVGGYAYGIAGINWVEPGGGTLLPLLVGVATPMALAAAAGLVMFYGRLQGVYVAILTFVMTLVAATFLNQTSGPQWHIGSAYLGGDNGLGRSNGELAGPPSLQLFDIDFSGPTSNFFYLAGGSAIVVLLAIRLSLRSRWGAVLAGIRDAPERTESFGYDVRLIQLVVFVIAAGLAGFSGVLFASWGNFITPSVFGVTSTILPVIWVAVAGRSSTVGAAIAAVGLGWTAQRLAENGNYASIILGGLLIVAVTVAPSGLAPALRGASQRLARRVLSPTES